jgi:hypothetical protein
MKFVLVRNKTEGSISLEDLNDYNIYTSDIDPNDKDGSIEYLSKNIEAIEDIISYIEGLISDIGLDEDRTELYFGKNVKIFHHVLTQMISAIWDGDEDLDDFDFDDEYVVQEGSSDEGSEYASELLEEEHNDYRSEDEEGDEEENDSVAELSSTAEHSVTQGDTSFPSPVDMTSPSVKSEEMVVIYDRYRQYLSKSRLHTQSTPLNIKSTFQDPAVLPKLAQEPKKPLSSLDMRTYSLSGVPITVFMNRQHD